MSNTQDRRRILVVDDDRMLCENLVDIFESNGFEAYCAFDEREAVQKVAKERPQVVLIDIRMPLMDNLSTMKVIKRLAPDAHVLLMSADTLDGDTVYVAKGEGAEAVLSKPLNCESLLRLISGEETHSGNRGKPQLIQV